MTSSAISSSSTLKGGADHGNDSNEYHQLNVFIIVVGFPHFLPNGSGSIFDGKICIRPLVNYVPAVRSSRNRAQGTMEVANLSITGEEYKNQLLKEDGIFEAIDRKLGAAYYHQPNNVTFRQEGAKPHVKTDTLYEIKQNGCLNGRRINVDTQPPNSPDLNLLDLAFNNSIQKTVKKIKYSVTSKDEFIDIVTKAFNDNPVVKLIRLCALQLVAYREILKSNGGNQYRMPHTGIRIRQNANFDHRHDLVEDCCDYIVTAEVIRTAVDQYEREAGHPFPWNQHPDYIHPRKHLLGLKIQLINYGTSSFYR